MKFKLSRARQTYLAEVSYQYSNTVSNVLHCNTVECSVPWKQSHLSLLRLTWVSPRDPPEGEFKWSSAPRKPAWCAKPTQLSFLADLWLIGRANTITMQFVLPSVDFLLLCTLILWEFASEAGEIYLKTPVLLKYAVDGFCTGTSQDGGKRSCN